MIGVRRVFQAAESRAEGGLAAPIRGAAVDDAALAGEAVVEAGLAIRSSGTGIVAPALDDVDALAPAEGGGRGRVVAARSAAGAEAAQEEAEEEGGGLGLGAHSPLKSTSRAAPPGSAEGSDLRPERRALAEIRTRACDATVAARRSVP